MTLLELLIIIYVFTEGDDARAKAYQSSKGGARRFDAGLRSKTLRGEDDESIVISHFQTPISQ